MDDTEKACRVKTSEWEERSATRKGEIEAMDSGGGGGPVAVTLVAGDGNAAFLAGGGVLLPNNRLTGTGLQENYLDLGVNNPLLAFAATNGFTFAAWVRHDSFQLTSDGGGTRWGA